MGISSLEELEVAAHDGRLGTLPGISHGRAQIIRSTLESVLTRHYSVLNRDPSEGPDVALLLQVDQEYREKSERGELPNITPRRFNPEQVAWLPVLLTVIGNWHFTALFSNTARAHELGRTSDWVLIYFYNNDHEEGQHTVVTETHGPLKGKRVVRGRELECKVCYEAAQSNALLFV